MIVYLKKLKEITEIEFWDIVEDAIITNINELRIILQNKAFQQPASLLDAYGTVLSCALFYKPFGLYLWHP